MKTITVILLIIACSQAEAGPYIEAGIDYDPKPAYLFGENVNITSSHYIARVAMGWGKQIYLKDRHKLTLKFKLFEHQSDPLKRGKYDLVSENGTRGVSIEYELE